MAQVDALGEFRTAPSPSHSRRRRAAARLAAVRLALAVPLALALSALTFALAALAPRDPLANYLGTLYRLLPPERLESLRGSLGLDAPWYEAWWNWLTAALTGDFGYSITFKTEIAAILPERLANSLLLAGAALVISTLLGVLLGLACGFRPGSWLDRTVQGVVLALQAIPAFVLALIAVAVFAVSLRWVPVAGMYSLSGDGGLADLAWHALAPVTILALAQLPWLTLGVRAAVLTAAREPWVDAARGRGVPARQLRRDLARLAAGPAAAIVGTRIGEIVVGAVVVEQIFAWPGIAQALTAAALNLDFNLLAALVSLITLLVLAGMALADLTHAALDARVVANA